VAWAHAFAPPLRQPDRAFAGGRAGGAVAWAGGCARCMAAGAPGAGEWRVAELAGRAAGFAATLLAKWRYRPGAGGARRGKNENGT